MKIICLKSQNVKRLKAVEIRPNGKSVVIAGKNDNGKSSVLDSIAYAIGGEKAICQRPIRDGQLNAEVTVETDTLTITRTFTPKGGTLKVVPKGGVAQAKPQTLLDDLIGNLTFDPLGFSRMKEEEQSKTLRQLVGLDFTQVDAERKRIYDERTQVNRDLTQQNARLAGKTLVVAPESEVQLSDIMTRKRAAEAVNKANNEEREKLRKIEVDISAIKASIDFHETHIKSLEQTLADAKSKVSMCGVSLSKRAAEHQAQAHICNDLLDEELDPFDQEIVRVQETNAKVRANQELREQQAKAAALEVQSKALTAKIDTLDKEKQATLAKTKFPLTGLGFSETGGVTFGAIPWDQISTAKQIKISTAIAMAINPKLRVMLIRDGSLMDDESLEAMQEMADANKFQLWIERVGDLDGSMPGVIIEDGEVVESTINGPPSVPQQLKSMGIRTEPDAFPRR